MSLSTATLSVVLTSMINVLGKSKGRRVRGMPMACHTSSRSEDRRPGARSRERRSLRGPAKVLGSRRSALRDAPRCSQTGKRPTRLSHTRVFLRLHYREPRRNFNRGCSPSPAKSRVDDVGRAREHGARPPASVIAQGVNA